MTCGEVWRVSLAFACFTTIALSLYTFLPVFLTTERGFSTAESGVYGQFGHVHDAFFKSSGGMVIGPVLFGGLVEAVGWGMAGEALVPVALLGFAIAWKIQVRQCVVPGI